jgi:hypothetical protein
VTGRPAEAVQYGCCAGQGGAKVTSAADKYGVPQPPQMRGKGGGGSGFGGEEDGGLGVPLNGNTVVGRGLTLVHFSAQLEPCLTHKNTLYTIITP